MKKGVVIFLILIIGIIGIKGDTIIDLKGSLKVLKPKSSQTQQLEAILSESELIVNFFDCLGNLTIEVVDENGMTVFNQTVNTCVTNTISINIKSWDAGNYIIRISDMGGGLMEGGFVIK